MTADEQVAAVEAAGLTARLWEGRSGTRVYIAQGGRELGYLVPGTDDGSTGTCRHVTRRAGYVASILRQARGERA